MPSLADLQKYVPQAYRMVRDRVESDEILVTDVRGQMTPAQMVEVKLRAALRTVVSEPARQQKAASPVR